MSSFVTQRFIGQAVSSLDEALKTLRTIYSVDSPEFKRHDQALRDLFKQKRPGATYGLRQSTAIVVLVIE